MRDTATERLRRILQLLPVIADEQVHDVDEVLEQTGFDRDTLLGDLVAVTERYDVSGAFEQGLQVVYDERTVSMHAPRFQRPPRVTRSELIALELGLSLVRRERPPDDWPVIDGALERLRGVIARLPGDDDSDPAYAADIAATARPGALGVLRRAVRERRKVMLEYQGSREAATTGRILRPYGFVFASGMWYVVGYCERSGGERIFRADRIESAALVDDVFTPPKDFSLGAFVWRHRAFDGGGAGTMKVRYSPAIARWIAEREGREVGADGSLTMEHAVADRAWAIRHVLQYGAEAEVLAPEELRHELREVLGRIAARMGVTTA